MTDSDYTENVEHTSRRIKADDAIQEITDIITATDLSREEILGFIRCSIDAYDDEKGLYSELQEKNAELKSLLEEALRPKDAFTLGNFSGLVEELATLRAQRDELLAKIREVVG